MRNKDFLKGGAVELPFCFKSKTVIPPKNFAIHLTITGGSMYSFFKFLPVSLILFVALFVQTQNSISSERATYVMPPNYSGTQGTATFLGPLSNAQRTIHLLIRDSILTPLIGQEITAFTFRLLASASSNWPGADVTFTNYDIYLSPGVAPENRSFTFADNIAGPQKRVRSGPLTIPAGSFPFGGSPTTFGTDINFDSAYIYTGGHLLIEIRHTGFTGTSASVDAASTSSSGYAFLYSSCWASSYTATSGGLQANFVVTRLNARNPVGLVNITETASQFSLGQNYPNPFNPVTKIRFEIPSTGGITKSATKLMVFNSLGQQVAQLVNGVLSPGSYEVDFDGSGLSSGVYYYRIESGEYSDIKKMMLVK